MSNFKPGSGDLDFGADDEHDETDTETTEDQTSEKQTIENPTTEENDSESPVTEESTPRSSDNTSSDSDSGATVEQSVSGQVSAGHPTGTTTSAEDYPYFVRRKNVGDERDNRLEIHVRDKVASQEGDFRSVLADHLNTNEITKTDAREFALLAAFHHPERVAELMEDEGFNALG